MRKTTINKIIDTQTPTRHIVIGYGEEHSTVVVRQYDFKNVEGHQILTVINNYPHEIWTHTTAGGGYCKQDAGLEHALCELGIAVADSPQGQLSRSYHVGGNYWHIDIEKTYKS